MTRRLSVLPWRGSAPNADNSGLDRSRGVICVVAVLPSYRRRGIGTALLRNSEDYLRLRGAQDILAGPMGPASPFTFAIYGGSQSPGFLDSDQPAQPFLLKNGYAVARACLVLQRQLDAPVVVTDGRFAAFRQYLEIHAGPCRETSWWQECMLGPVELHDYRLREKGNPRTLARANVWEMETFSQRWNEHAIGFVDLEVAPEFRRRGLAKFLIAQLLRHFQDQFFSMAEFQVPQENVPTLQLLGGLGFQQVDVGRQFRKVS